MHKQEAFHAATYEQAAAFIRDIGILPFSSFIPGHPSMDSITLPGQWHTGLSDDPWLWRDRLAGEGLAAYGRFLAKKPVLIAAEWFPLVRNLLEEPYSVEERYEDGELPKAAVDIYRAVEAEEGIDTRRLRAVTGLATKDSKAAFDRALNELQSKADLVIGGISDRLTADGVKSGWNSACYLTAGHWMEKHGLDACHLPTPEAKAELRRRLSAVCSEAALAYMYKIFRL
ncbi:hypothetical protein B5M42_005360 [Paenibacillus athensensis]|uniref:Uncharacterized protein n=1 Tax=Paenibacillus athensensis TaxID=1967502 RepID=A0A4Y8Q307_9BACL|nr:hypothetical protein [Paenibacillus athensensis]MCD1258268.1 hypothetical protein [Paenibacillus athensensis]